MVINKITSAIPIKPATKVLVRTPAPYDALTFWLDISVNLVEIEPALMFDAKFSASSFSKLPVIITSEENPWDTVAADKHMLSSLPQVSPSLLYELTPFSKLYHITITFLPVSFWLTSVVASKNFSLSLTDKEIAGLPFSSYESLAPLITLASIKSLSSVSRNDTLATLDKAFLAPSISVTPASFTLILSSPSIVISGSDTPSESTFLFKTS